MDKEGFDSPMRYKAGSARTVSRNGQELNQCEPIRFL